MGKPKFTPGPWAPLPQNGLDIRSVATGEPVAYAYFPGLPLRITAEESEANIHLITAAPDLYEALETAAAAIALAEALWGPIKGDEALFRRAAQKVQAAVAKARGEVA